MKPHKHAAVIKANLHRLKYCEDGTVVWADNYGPRARKGKVVGTKDSSGYLQIKMDNYSVLVHRIIWIMFNESYPEQLDHINRDRTDNRIENLRPATNTTNQHNASLRKDNNSGFTGVVAKGNKFEARINVNKKRIHVGVFSTLNEAVIARHAAKLEYHNLENKNGQTA